MQVVNELQLLTAKPMVVVLNMCEDDYVRRKNKWLPKIKQWVDAHGGDPIVPLSCALEKRLLDMSPDDAAAFFKEKGCTTALPKIIHTVSLFCPASMIRCSYGLVH